MWAGWQSQWSGMPWAAKACLATEELAVLGREAGVSPCIYLGCCPIGLPQGTKGSQQLREEAQVSGIKYMQVNGTLRGQESALENSHQRTSERKGRGHNQLMEEEAESQLM